jgi:hypothetical protein
MATMNRQEFAELFSRSDGELLEQQRSIEASIRQLRITPKNDRLRRSLRKRYSIIEEVLVQRMRRQ